jgi:hypothetical protein
MSDFTCYCCNSPKSILEFGEERVYLGKMVILCDDCLEDLQFAIHEVMDSSFILG